MGIRVESTDVRNNPADKEKEQAVRTVRLFIDVLEYFSGGERCYTPRTLIGDLFSEVFDEKDWAVSLIVLQVLFKVELPVKLVCPRKLTIREFMRKVGSLPRVEDDLHAARMIGMLISCYDEDAADAAELVTSVADPMKMN